MTGHNTTDTTPAVKSLPRAMESYMTSGDISPFISTCGDSTLMSDFMDASIYASSPNSLFMYDQEKIDMQSSMGVTTTCTSIEAGVSEEFELKAQYEVSQDISNFPIGESTPSAHATASYTQSSGRSRGWGGDKLEKKDVYIKMENQDEVSLTPTLAELNMNFDLLEDINSYINVEMGQYMTPKVEMMVPKTEPGCSEVRACKEATADIMGQAGGSSQPVLTNLTPVQQNPLNVVIKTEPGEAPAVMLAAVNSHKSFTPMTAVKPELIVPRSVPALPLTPLSTIKEIDISDFTTLQNLLKRSDPLQARAQAKAAAQNSRRRTVSETQVYQQRSAASRKRSVATAGLESMDRKWEEIKQFLDAEALKPGPGFTQMMPVKRERTRYDSTSSVMTLTSNEDEDSDSDKDYDDDSDSDMEGGHDIGSLNPEESLINTKEKQYFWQYNVQSKGPKGTRVHFDLEEDPHVLNDFEDPVFDPSNSSSLSNIGVIVKHGGKARKGDGNDIVPSPRKLCQIGLQLRKINRQINDFAPVSELPSNARSKTRKEKNKLASRACRLKKKAQHEANKVKLHGLESEHRKLLTVIRHMQKLVLKRIHHVETDAEQAASMTDTLENNVQHQLGDMKIAGNTTDYVNCVIHKVEAGDQTGGIKIKATRSYPIELQN